MTNEVNYAPVKYGCNGSTVDFSFSWKIFSVEDLIVILEDETTKEQITLKDGVDYMLYQDIVGGYIVTSSVYPRGKNIIIARSVSQYQSKSYSTSSGFQTKEIEESFDKLSANVQDLSYTLQRALKVPVGSGKLNVEFPEELANDNTLVWSEEKQQFVNYDVIGEMDSFEQEIETDVDAFKNSVNQTLQQNKENTDADIVDFKQSVNSEISSFKQTVNTQIETFEQETESDVNAFKNSVNQTLLQNKQNTDADISNFKQSVNSEISSFKQEQQKAYNEFTAGVDEKVAKVAEAAEKIDELEESVTIAVKAAEDATNAAENAASAAEELTDALGSFATKEELEEAIKNVDVGDFATKTDVANKQDKFTTSLPLIMGGLKTSTTNISYDNNGKAYLNDVAYYATIEDCLPTEPLSNYEKRRSFFDGNYANSECKFEFYKLKGYTEQYPILNLDGYNSILRNFEVGDIVMSDSITPYSGDYNDVELCFGKIEDDGTFIPKLMCMTYGWSDSARFAKVVYLHSPNESYKRDRDRRNSTAFIANYTNNESRTQLSYKNASGIENIGNIRGVKFIEKDSAVTIAWVYENGETVELSDIGTFDKIDFNCVLFTGFVFDNSEVTDTGIYGFDSSKYYVAKDTIDNVIVRMTDGTSAKSISLKYNTDDFFVENEALKINPEKIPTMPIGQIISVNANDSYVPDGTLPCDGAEYSREQFPDLWDNYLINGLLNTVSIAEWLEEVGPDKGNCTKFGIDIYSETFRVPLINKVLTDIADTVGVVGNGKVIEYTNGTDAFTLIDTSSNGIYPKTNAVGLNVGDAAPTSGGNLTKHYTGIGLSQNAETSGIIADTTSAKTYSELRYFVVVANGQTNQSMMDWSAWASSLQGKLNADHSNDPYPYIKEFVTSGTDGYIVYSNGSCEQWGFVSNVGTSATINLYKEYSDIYYNKTLGVTTNSANDTGGVSDVTVLQNTTDTSTTTTSFNISSLSGVSVYWRTIGKLK